MKKCVRNKNALGLFLALFLQVAPSRAEELKVKLYVEPSNAQVLIEPGSKKGAADQPFLVTIPTSPAEKVTFKLTAPNYQPQELSFTAAELRASKRFPSEGAYEMAPVSAPWKWPLAIAVTFLAVGGAIAAKRRGEPEPASASAARSRRASGPQLGTRATSSTSQNPAPRYTIDEEIGEGGMALVYRGTSLKAPGRPVAIKVIRPELLEDSDARKRFQREVEICSTLRHDHLVRVFDSGVGSKGEMFLVMELLEGVDLDEELESDPTPSKEKIASIIVPLCEALSYIHGKGLVHRDIKPSNIFLDAHAGVKLVDLGIARGLDFEAVTRTGVAVGSPHYMAPEQAKGDVRPENDQYSVGVLLFEMLAGVRPYEDGDAIEIITQHLTAPIPSLYAHAPGAGLLMESVIQRMMAKRPEARFASIAEASVAIQSALADDDGFDDATCNVMIPD